jgi:glycosyltransferase involved in cell wall biosynthesis
MISILVPVYNFRIVTLVEELHRQVTLAGIPFEIIVMDDGSSLLLKDQNKEVAALPGVTFIELAENIGRSRIRNKLASMATYSSLLFMDCDAEIPDPEYINNYLPYCGKDVVVCGGRTYHSEPPEEPEHILRWLYGVHREQIPATIRSQNPYHSFMTANFMISKAVLSRIGFDESIIQYGHEDTLFGFELRKNNIPVIHIQNPLVHIGLEIAREFLRKTSESVSNLISLVEHGKISLSDCHDIRLLRAFESLRRMHMVRIYLKVYYQVERAVMRNLTGSNPSLRAFDMYKLFLLTKLVHQGNHPIPALGRL